MGAGGAAPEGAVDFWREAASADGEGQGILLEAKGLPFKGRKFQDDLDGITGVDAGAATGVEYPNKGAARGFGGNLVAVKPVADARWAGEGIGAVEAVAFGGLIGGDEAIHAAGMDKIAGEHAFDDKAGDEFVAGAGTGRQLGEHFFGEHGVETLDGVDAVAFAEAIDEGFHGAIGHEHTGDEVLVEGHLAAGRLADAVVEELDIAQFGDSADAGEGIAAIGIADAVLEAGGGDVPGRPVTGGKQQQAAKKEVVVSVHFSNGLVDCTKDSWKREKD